MTQTFAHGYALLIGVGQSAEPRLSLPVTVKDMQALRQILVSPELCAYPNDNQHVRLLHDQGATRQAILDGLTWLKEQATNDRESTVIVYYSGHGWLDTTNNRYYLIPHDFDAYDWRDTALEADGFNNALHQIPAQRLLVILDCCHAAGIATAKDGESEPKLPRGVIPTAEPKGVIDALKQGEGRVVFTSCRGEQKSWIRPDNSMSVYTYHLIEALQGAASQPGATEVTVFDLANHLGKAVPESARVMGKEQTPRFEGDTERFAIALLQGGKGLPAGGWDAIKQSSEDTNPRVVHAAGERSVAVGGNVSDSNLVTGNDNVVGSGNVVQRGKYNLNTQSASGFRIGDTIYAEKPQTSGKEEGLESKDIGFLNKSSNVEIPVYFATDRKRSDSASVKTIYGGTRNQTGQLEFGLAKVSIPEDHRMGNLERPRWWKLEFHQDPTKHVILLGVEIFEQEHFLRELRKSIVNSNEPDVLLFIHGYNTSFEDAALRTAQIAYDLHFSGPAILYSWPSAAKFEMYPADENNIEWTIPHFKEFLYLLLTAVGARTVNAIAHSMGNRALARAVNELNFSALPEGKAALHHIIFAAPDIDADTFRQFAKEFWKKAERFTLYASSKDKALEASRLFHGGYPRAGDSGTNLVIVDGIDTIDASLIDTSLIGHSYFGDNRSILSDIFYLLKHNLPPKQRSSLVSKAIGSLYYWLFQA